MSLKNLKKELESALLITEWSPSDNELREIAKKLKAFRGEPSKANVEKIVIEVVGSYQAICLEGIDNSDLTTLLLLATKSVSNDD